MKFHHQQFLSVQKEQKLLKRTCFIGVKVPAFEVFKCKVTLVFFFLSLPLNVPTW